MRSVLNEVIKNFNIYLEGYKGKSIEFFIKTYLFFRRSTKLDQSLAK